MMKTIYLLISIIVGCSNFSSTKAMDEIDHHSTSELLAPKNLQQFNLLKDIDSIIEETIQDETMTINVYHGDSIKQYKHLTSLFHNSETIGEISITNSKNRLPVYENGLYKAISSLTLYKISFQDIVNLEMAYVSLFDDIESKKIKGKLLLKTGGVIFIYEGSLIVLPISSCGREELLNKIIDRVNKAGVKDFFALKCGGTFK